MSLKTALIVEDDEGFQYYLSKLLKHIVPNVNVYQATDGLEALSLLDDLEEHPNIIFLDINMPSMNGHEFLEMYKDRHQEKCGKILVISSSDQERDQESVRSYDFVSGYIVKPVYEETLRQYI